MKKMIVVRPIEPMNAAEFGQARDYFSRQTKFDILLVPYGFEVLTPAPDQETPAPDDELDIEAAREEIVNAYDAGKIIEYNPIGDPSAGWIQAHRTASPHRFEWDDNYYRLPPARR